MRKLFQDCLADAGTQAEEALSSVRTVKSFSGEAKATSVYSDFINESYKIGKKLALAQGNINLHATSLEILVVKVFKQTKSTLKFGSDLNYICNNII